MRQLLIFALLAWTHAQSVVAAATGSTPLPLFADNRSLSVTLEGPLQATLADRDARQERPFVLQTEQDGAPDVPLEVRVRGKSRAAVCKLAPLRLDFDGEAASGTLFEGQDKLKLVLPCRDHDRAERDLLEEYLAYRIFNQLSDASYRVRLLRIRLVETEGGRSTPSMELYGFVLESHDGLSTRLGEPEAALPAVRRSELDSRQAALAFLFQYLIGNTDWSLVAPDGEADCCHNLRLFGASPPLTPVPYDFDRAGLVNAPYAKPDPSLRLRSVTQRRYRGYCIDPAALGPALDRILANRLAILGLPRSLPLLSERQIEGRVRYLEGFFERADDRDELLERLRDSCL